MAQTDTETLHYFMVTDLLKQMGSVKQDLMHCAVGISGESGELLDAIKKHWAYDTELDMENVIEELGDVEFYLAGMRQLLGISRDSILAHNILKLRKRYATGKYSDQQAKTRADKLDSGETT